MQILCCLPRRNKINLFILQLSVGQVLSKIIFFLVVFFSYTRGKVKYFPANDLFPLKGRNSD